MTPEWLNAEQQWLAWLDGHRLLTTAFDRHSQRDSSVLVFAKVAPGHGAAVPGHLTDLLTESEPQTRRQVGDRDQLRTTDPDGTGR